MRTMGRTEPGPIKLFNIGDSNIPGTLFHPEKPPDGRRIPDAILDIDPPRGPF